MMLVSVRRHCTVRDSIDDSIEKCTLSPTLYICTTISPPVLGHFDYRSITAQVLLREK